MVNIIVNLLIMITIIFMIHFLIFDYSKFFMEYKPFECGFENMYWLHQKLNIHFFKIGIVFILFDLELLLLVLSFSKFMMLIWIIMIFIFFSLWIEFKSFSINWTM
uniref:NADH-ubiquinone oxidoreductase chain 3 n=1 Tax=Agamermis sp. BH-2006 TaxID=390897 RepID=Q0Z873_9BILA|nr:NADH dehydrogenase subunit 3 [Agamermis sp. BH-2006]ABG38301.1 NADH dehydrogenase subunit 3 [Agamermis sp. BH-2006]